MLESIVGIISFRGWVVRSLTISLGFMSSVLVSSSFFVACSDKEDKKTFDFGAPKVAEIVDAAAPKGLTGSTTSLAPECASFNPNAPVTGGWQLMDNYLSYLKCATFQKNANTEGPAYYRYWVDVLDAAMASTNSRLNGAADSLPACISAAPVEKTFNFDVEKTSGTDAVSVTMKLNCFEDQNGPTGASQVMAFGKDDTHFYLVYLTKTVQTLAATGDGFMVVLAKADAAGNEADIWFIGNSYQGGEGVVPSDKISTVVNRVIANKSTGAFTYAIAESVIGLTKQSNFIRSDGTNMYFKGQTANPGMGSMSVQDIVDGSSAAEFCFGATDLSTKTLATCTGASLDDVPSNFGMTEAPRSKATTSFFSDLKADVNSIIVTDFAAAGIGRFGDGSVKN